VVALVGATSRGVAILTILLLAACAPWQPEPDADGESRAGGETGKRVIATPPAWYQVKRGDTLYSIAFRYGLDWRNVARWNSIGSPYTIRPGQELRMTAPRPRQAVADDGRPSGSSDSESRKPAPEPEPESQSEPEPEPNPPKPERSDSRVESPRSSPSAAPAASSEARTVAGLAWQWPTDGRLARSFDPADTRKGIGVAGKVGQDVLAAASGRVVYSGTALIGYGELIIIKHSDKLLSAYGHNRRRLVGEGDRVQRGEKIAEMGRDDRREEMLHFEIRRDGEPVNPLDYLPKR